MSDAWALFKGSGFSYDNADAAAFLEVINSAKAVMEKRDPSEEEMSGAAVALEEEGRQFAEVIEKAERLQDVTAQQDVDEAVCTLKDAMDHLGTAAYKKDEMLKK